MNKSRIGEIAEIARTLFSRWWTYMSCAIWTFLCIATSIFNPSATTQKAVYLVLTAASILFVPIRIIFILRRKNEELKKRSPEIKLEVIDYIAHRSNGDSSRWQYADIFIKASAQVLSPSSITVEYSLDLIRQGSNLRATIFNDLGKWHIVKRKALDPLGPNVRTAFYQDIQPLDTLLLNTKKSDGWLHFRIEELRDHEIANSKIRLAAVSADGMAYIEYDLIGNVGRPWIVMPKIG